MERTTSEEFVSIGRLSSATGISPDRLRIWERRYGRPSPIRRPSGHRRYPAEEIVALKRVADLLVRGGRPGELLVLSDEELARRHSAIARETPQRFEGMERWLRAVESFAERELRQELERAAATMSRLELLDKRLTSVLAEIGHRWEEGELDVRHEHFAARVFEDFLRELRHHYGVGPDSPKMVLATLPSERNGLGLTMLAVLCAEHGIDGVLLATDTPIEEIVQSVKRSGAEVVAVSISESCIGPKADQALRDLRKALPAKVELIAGGAGVAGGRRGPRGVQVLRDLKRFRRWMNRRFPKPNSSR